MSDSLPVRFCPVCRQADDHPRHVIWGQDPNVARHMDCCREAGCPDGSCDAVLSSVTGEPKGEELREEINRHKVAIQRRLEERDEETRHFTLDGEPTELTA